MKNEKTGETFYGFKIKFADDSRDYDLACRNEAEINKWMKAIQMASFQRVLTEVDKLKADVKALHEAIMHTQTSVKAVEAAARLAAENSALAASRAASATMLPGSGRPVSIISTSSGGGDEPMYRHSYEAFKPGDVGRMAMAAASAARCTAAPSLPGGSGGGSATLAASGSSISNGGAGAAVQDPPSPDSQATLNPAAAAAAVSTDPFAPVTPGKRANIGERTHSANAALNVEDGVRNIADFVLTDAVFAEDSAASGDLGWDGDSSSGGGSGGGSSGGGGGGGARRGPAVGFQAGGPSGYQDESSYMTIGTPQGTPVPTPGSGSPNSVIRRTTSLVMRGSPQTSNLFNSMGDGSNGAGGGRAAAAAASAAVATAAAATAAAGPAGTGGDGADCSSNAGLTEISPSRPKSSKPPLVARRRSSVPNISSPLSP